MKWIRTLCTAAFALSTVAFAQVSITGNEPVTGGTFTSPVTISAFASSPNGVSGWAVYFNNTEVYSNSTGLGGVLDVTVTPPNGPGNYKVTVTAWDTTGAHTSYVATNVTVNSSPLPTPPGDATLYPNLQNASGNPGTWSPCTGSCAGSGGSGSGSDSFNNPSPSLSHASMGQTSNGSYFNTMYYRHLGCPSAGCTGVSNFLDDVWFYIPSTTTHLQALEFDPDVYDGSYEYFMSMQCDSASGKWRFWDMAAGKWTVQNSSGGTIPTYGCSLLSQTNQWHHLQLYGTMNYSAKTYTYQTFVIDGVTVYSNINNTYDAKTYSGGETLNIEQQIDNNSSAGTNTVYYDNYNLWVW